MSSLRVDTDAIRQLAEILLDTGLTEIEVSEKDSRIRVVRAPAVIQAAVPAPAPAAAAPPTAAAPPAPINPGELPGAVKSPMVGIAYLSPEPSAAAYVTFGQSVAAGQTLLLIEAMKTFNQIKAPKAGTVTHILITSGVPVEYGEPLMVIE